ncbi:MAG: hypothetical protein NUK65_09185, partial [Firmicutes bacterium]|nr:hypothetical protein [Bacillota bacterium]
MNQHLWKQVETSLSHLEELRRSDLPDYELSSLLLAELTAALQELQATTAEVMEQNEELATSRQ